MAAIAAAWGSGIDGRLNTLVEQLRLAKGGWLIRSILNDYGKYLFQMDPLLFQNLALSDMRPQDAGNVLIKGAEMLVGPNQREVARTALRHLTMIGDSLQRIGFMVRAVRFVPEDQRDAVIEKVVPSVEEIPQEHCAALLKELVHVVSSRTVDLVSNLLTRVQDPDRRTTLACELAGYLPESDRALFVSALVRRDRPSPDLPKGLLQAAALPISVAALAPYVSEADLPNLFEPGDPHGHTDPKLFKALKGKLESESSRRIALCAADRLPDYNWLEARIGLMSASKVAARLVCNDVVAALADVTVDNPFLAFSYLESAAVAAPESCLSGFILLVSSEMGSDVERSRFLTRLGHRVPAPEADLFIDKARQVLGGNDVFLAAPVAAIATRVDGARRKHLTAEAWNYIRRITYFRDHVEASVVLSEALSQADRDVLWEEVLAFLEAEEREGHFYALGLVSYNYVDGFAIIAEKGPASLLPNCLRALTQQRYNSTSERLLESVGRRWPELRTVTGVHALDALVDVLLYLSREGRGAVLSGLRPLLPSIHEVVGASQILHMISSVRRTAEWWP